MKEASGKVFLQCVASQSEVTWLKDGNKIGNKTQLDLGAIYDDPRGMYTCEKGGKRSSLQVHYRSKCCKPGFYSQNCLEHSPKMRFEFEGTTDFSEFEGGSTSLRKSRQLLC